MGEISGAANTADFMLWRSLHAAPREVTSAKHMTVNFSDGSSILDTTGGAAVACLGHGNARVKDAMIAQMDRFSYTNSMFFSSRVGQELANELIMGTQGRMAKAYIVSSGSEAIEAAMKLARQYFLELSTPQLQRIKFIARVGSYHGTTLGALSMSGHKLRRKLFEPILMPHIERVSNCYAYRGMKPGQTEQEYVAELAQELDDKFQSMGSDTVCAFVAEPVVGATLGGVPAVPGYFQAMKAVCDKYGALLILDEVMSGMGRCGTLHEWEQEGVVPDIQAIGKGLGAGYASVAGLLLGHRVVDVLKAGSGAFAHGHTYQGHPVACAAALEVQRVIREENLVENCRKTGTYFGKLLHEYLDDHPHVGDVRGKGCLWGIEFVEDKETKSPFPLEKKVALNMHDFALQEPYGISVYPGNGSVDGTLGDHVFISPPYNLTMKEMEMIAERTKAMISDYFKQLK